MISSDDLKKRAHTLEQKSFYELFDILVECSDHLKQIKPVKRRPWLVDVIREIYNDQNGKCAICGEPLEFGSHEVDHVIPFCYGGGNERGNLQITCLSCNRKKRSSVEPQALLHYLEDRFMNR
ncbi:MAG: HNH endonuclease [Candidatus Methylumidiphilus sp.]